MGPGYGGFPGCPRPDSWSRRANRELVPGVVLSMRWVAFLGTVVLLAACHRGATSAQMMPTLGQPAREVARDLFVCPGGFGWAAYGGLVYPPNDSSKPTADIRPDRCFS